MTEEVKRKRGQRGPGKKGRMAHVTMRLPQDVVDYFGGSSIRMREALIQYVTRSRAMDELIEADGDLV